MTIRIGDSSIKDIYLGGDRVQSIYLGHTLVYGSGPINPAYNYYVFDTSLVEGSTTVSLYYYRAGDETEWDGYTDWGDGIVNTEYTHTYATDGIYTVKTKWMINYPYHIVSDYTTFAMLTKCLNVNKNITEFRGLFRYCSNLESVNFAINYVYSANDNMSEMFRLCSSLTSIEMPNFNTFNVTNMNSMFESCYALTNINLSSFNTSNVTDMGDMFRNCQSLNSLDLSNFNTHSVTNMSYMFYDCCSMPSLNLSSFNTASVVDMSWMFSLCHSLTSLNISYFDMNNVLNSEYMFQTNGALKLENINMANCDSYTRNKIANLLA